MYGGCADGTDKATLDMKGLATGIVGGYAHRFPARSDQDAIAFARAARPQCRLTTLYRLHRRLFTSGHHFRYRRTPIDLA